MTSATTTSFSQPRRSGIRGIFSAIAAGFVAHADRMSRADRVRALDAKSDAELAKLGIQRDQIPYYVFRDRFYI